jgi:hypothetical protein
VNRRALRAKISHVPVSVNAVIRMSLRRSTGNLRESRVDYSASRCNLTASRTGNLRESRVDYSLEACKELREVAGKQQEFQVDCSSAKQRDNITQLENSGISRWIAAP